MLDLEILRRASVLADLTDAERDAMRAEREQQEPDREVRDHLVELANIEVTVSRAVESLGAGCDSCTG